MYKIIGFCSFHVNNRFGFLDTVKSFDKVLTFTHNALNIKIKSVAYNSQGSQAGQLDFCNWLADNNTTG